VGRQETVAPAPLLSNAAVGSRIYRGLAFGITLGSCGAATTFLLALLFLVGLGSHEGEALAVLFLYATVPSFVLGLLTPLVQRRHSLAAFARALVVVIFCSLASVILLAVVWALVAKFFVGAA
jgi:hypothetical protein